MTEPSDPGGTSGTDDADGAQTGLNQEMLTHALEWYAAGYTPVPISARGEKRPLGRWAHLLAARPDQRDVQVAFEGADTDGLGIICGPPSGELEMFECEARAIDLIPTLGELMESHGLGELWHRIMWGYVESTPSGGVHWYYRVDGPARENTKLASRPATQEELAANPGDKVKVLFETRGRGGFTVVAPSRGRSHPNQGAWTVLRGAIATIPTLTVDERDALHAITSMLDAMPLEEYHEPVVAPRARQPGDPLRPGDDFNIRAGWESILIPCGWTRVRPMGGGWTWTRPGKHPRDGVSGTTGQAADGVDRLFVFSTSTPFEAGRPYDKFAAWAVLHGYGGDLSAAAGALAKIGYGQSPMDPLMAELSAPVSAPAPLLDSPAITMSSQVDTTGTATPGAATTPGAGLPGLWATLGIPTLPEDADDAQVLFHRRVAEQMIELHVRDRAGHLFAEAITPPAPPFDIGTLGQILARDEEPPNRIEHLMPWEGSTLVVAQRKTGKTTLVLNYIYSLLTGEPFLGRFAVVPIEADARVALLNFEVSAALIADWAHRREVDPDRLVIANLRGRRNPLKNGADREDLARMLREHKVESVIIDPLGRAFTGADSDRNGDMQQFLVTLDEWVRGDVGAKDLLLAAHAGWAAKDRARGASAIEDWADAIWVLTREDGEDPVRLFKAEGRGVDVDTQELYYDRDTGILTLAEDARLPKKERDKERRLDLLTPIIVTLVGEEPGITTTEIKKLLDKGGDLYHERPHGYQKEDVYTVATRMAALGRLEATPAPHRALTLRLIPTAAESAQ